MCYSYIAILLNLYKERICVRYGCKGEKVMPEFKYEVVKELGVVSEAPNGWKKELNLVSWNDREPVYDLRTWSPEKDRMGKGITLSEEEVQELKAILAKLA